MQQRGGRLSTLLVLAVAAAMLGAGHAPSRPMPAPVRPVASGAAPFDFNGDGFADLVLTAQGESLHDANQTYDRAGALNLLYGGAGGASADGNQFWSQDTPYVKGASEDQICDGQGACQGDGDGFGAAVASADFDQDGYADLAVGVPRESIGGGVNVLYGSRTGLTAAGDQLLVQSGREDESFDSFGASLAAGDLDGDGYPDLAVGVPYESLGTVNPATGHESTTGAGAVVVYRGGGTGLTDGMRLVEPVSGSGMSSDTANDEFGFALAVGHFDDDRYADLVVGVPNREVAGQEGSPGDDVNPGSGEVHLFRGSSSGPRSDSSAQQWSQNSTGIKGAAAIRDRFGAALAVGDFDNDGRDDLAVAVPNDNDRRGAAAVLYGGGDGLTARDQLVNEDTPGAPGVQERGDAVEAIAAGNLFGDDADELVLGMRYETLGDIASAGAVLVLPGTPTGLTGDRSRLLTQDTSGISGAPQVEDFFGSGVQVLDLGRSAYQDLVIGVPGDFPGRRRAGQVHVLYGGRGAITGQYSQTWNQDSTGVRGTAEAGDAVSAARPNCRASSLPGSCG